MGQVYVEVDAKESRGISTLNLSGYQFTGATVYWDASGFTGREWLYDNGNGTDFSTLWGLYVDNNPGSSYKKTEEGFQEFLTDGGDIRDIFSNAGTYWPGKFIFDNFPPEDPCVSYE